MATDMNGNNPVLLLDVIAADPEYHLGHAGTLPFLLKLLCAEQALSIQAHPTKAQAEEGFAEEESRGIPRDAFSRNYRDDNHKPELLVALTPFEALAGFRPIQQTLELFATLDIPELNPFKAMLQGEEGTAAEDLRALLTTFITLPESPRERLVDAVVTGCLRLAPDAPTWMREVAETVVALQEQYPRDVGILVALLLNKLSLQPGEAIYLDAGQLHAYVRGLGVEVMANSDNVLRGGLTSKYIDVPELMRVLDSEPLKDPLTRRDDQGKFPTPARDFTLENPPVGEERQVHGPAIVLCAGGEVQLRSNQPPREGDATEYHLSPGDAVWISHGEAPVTVLAKSSPGAFIASC